MFSSIRVGAARGALAVVAVFSDQKKTLPASHRLGAAASRACAAALRTPGFRADLGETCPAGEGHLLLGLGDRSRLEPSGLRIAAARLVKALDRIGAKAARLHVAAVVPAAVADAHGAGRSIGEGIGLANWRVDFFEGTASKRSGRHPALVIGADDAPFAAGVKEGLVLASCTNEARRLAAMPPNVRRPPWVAQEARRLARRAGLSCKVIGYAEASRLGMGGLVAVGRGSTAKPCIVVLGHRPQRAARGVHLVLVGKTMTYDTGGYSLKVNNGMKGMKYDGSGGCAVVGTMLALAALKARVRVTALLPCAENMVSGDSYRPDDIITMYNGVTVEVTNTDAEGRLILADALAWAGRHLAPTAIVDIATLTGGVVVALGPWCAGQFCNDDALRERLDDAAETTGERLWRLPLWDEHRDFMRARHADLWNSGPKRDGHPIQGAAFLSYFAPEGVPWAHLDVAGTSAIESDQDLFVTGPTGFGVRLLTELARSMAK